MDRKVNERIEKQEVPYTNPVLKKKKNFFGSLFMDILGGDFLAYEWVRRQTNYVFFLVAIALLYISNSYYAEDMSRQIDGLNAELKELHYEYISSKSELMQQTKQSEIAKKLQYSGLNESTEPVKKLLIKKADYK
ncbi:MAG: hypothetical protein KJ578_07745 [Bacteroidetes bacterium]|nr:hypothetical protein [Bacteroidota bacterium]MBU1580614.1 hypothetical protein [Bacteroidota bacterium]MBU2466451.1 hypothetical protein [Bacteroidota bacterium]MBU2557656.1 hypothetical protein [Bacteroidota bacterium]